MYHNTTGMVKPADLFAEFGFESGDMQKSNEEQMVEPVERLELLEIDQPGVIFVFNAL